MNILSTRRGSAMLLAAAALSLMSFGAHAQTTITFSAAQFAEPGRGDALREWVTKFNNSQSEVFVEPVTIPFSSYATTIFTQMGGGGGPDLIRFDLPEYHAAANIGRLLPLNDHIDESQYNFTSADAYMKVNGVRFGVPFETANYALIYNADLLPDGTPPTTFEEFLDYAQQATTDGNYGFAFRATMAERGGVWYDVTNFIYGFGGRWSLPDGTPTFNSPEVVAGIQAYKDVYDAGTIPRGTDAATYRRMFWEGRIAMVIDNGGVASTLTTQGEGLNILAAPSPFPHPEQGMILAPVTINANTQAPEAAATFLRWTLEPEQQQELQAMLGAANVAIVVDRTEEELARMPWVVAYDDQTPNSVPSLAQGLEEKSPDIQQIVVEQLLRVLQGGVDPQEAMDEAQRLVETRVVGQ